MTNDTQVVRYVSECDVVPVGQPLPREQALGTLRELLDRHPSNDYTLTDARTGRFVSWVLR